MVHLDKNGKLVSESWNFNIKITDNDNGEGQLKVSPGSEWSVPKGLPAPRARNGWCHHSWAHRMFRLEGIS